MTIDVTEVGENDDFGISGTLGLDVTVGTSGSPGALATVIDEVAFGQGPWQSDPTWTAITPDSRTGSAPGFATGRSQRFGQSESTSATLTLDNSGRNGGTPGQYTPGFNGGPHHPLTDGVLFRRRVEYPNNSGNIYPIWTGHVTDWRADFEGAASPVAEMSVAQTLAKLGERKLRHQLFEQTRLAAPDLFWPLTDEAGADKAVEESGRLGPPLKPVWLFGESTGTMEFGVANAPGVEDNITLAAWSAVGVAAEALQANIATSPAFVPYGSIRTGNEYIPTQYYEQGEAFTVECWFRPESSADGATVIAVNGTILATVDMSYSARPSAVLIQYSGTTLTVDNRMNNSTQFAVSTTITHGRMYHLRYTQRFTGTAPSPGDLQGSLYLDGVLVATGEVKTGASTLYYSSLRATQVTVGGTTNANASAALSMEGQISHVAIWLNSIPTDDLAKRVEVGLTGADGETSAERFARFMAFAGVPLGWYITPTTTAVDSWYDEETATLPTGMTRFSKRLAAQNTDGRTVLDVIREVESAEAGELLVSGSGQIVLRSAEDVAYRRSLTAAVLDPAKHFDLDGGFSTDNDGVVNEAIISRPALDTDNASRDAGTPQQVEAQSSIERRGRQTLTETIPVRTDVETEQHGYWLVNTRSEPGQRLPKVRMNAARLHDEGMLHTVLSLKQGDVIVLGSSEDVITYDVDWPYDYPVIYDVDIAPSALPLGSPRSLLEVVVDRIQHTIGTHSWDIELTPSQLVPLFQIENTERGRLSANPATIYLDTAIDADDTSVIAVTQDFNPPLTDRAGDLPFDIDIDGERIRVTAVSSDTSPQTLTMTRGVAPTTAMPHAAGAFIQIWEGGRLRL